MAAMNTYTNLHSGSMLWTPKIMINLMIKPELPYAYLDGYTPNKAQMSTIEVHLGVRLEEVWTLSIFLLFRFSTAFHSGSLYMPQSSSLWKEVKHFLSVLNLHMHRFKEKHGRDLYSEAMMTGEGGGL